MPWEVRLTRRAERDLLALPKSDQGAVRIAIQALEVDPTTVDLRKLSGARDEWRVRVGRWRIRLLLDGDVLYVERVLDRKDAYR
jgi:mRNA-degrading endonuclease RelE of RelBE toxin-antitoxin system